MEILSQCIHISNHHIVHVKYVTILFVNYTSIKLEKFIKESVIPKKPHKKQNQIAKMVVEFKEGRPYRLEFLQKDHRESETFYAQHLGSWNIKN